MAGLPLSGSTAKRLWAQPSVGHDSAALFFNHEFVDTFQSNFFDVLRRQLQSSVLYDVTLQVQDEEFPAHKIILVAASPYFEAMFSQNLKEGGDKKIHLQGLHAEFFGDVLHYMYTGCVDISEDNAFQIYSLSSYLALDTLFMMCSKWLRSKVTQDNCLSIISLSCLHSDKALSSKTVEFAADNFPELSTQEEFLSLSANVVSELLLSDDLAIGSEDECVQALNSWYCHAPSERKDSTEQLLDLCRIPFCSETFILQAFPTLRLCTDFFPVVKFAEFVSSVRGIQTQSDETAFAIEKPRRGFSWEEKLIVLSAHKVTSEPLIHIEKEGTFQLQEKPTNSPFPSACEVIPTASCIANNTIVCLPWKFPGKPWIYDFRERQWRQVEKNIGSTSRAYFMVAGCRDIAYICGGKDLGANKFLKSVSLFRPGPDSWADGPEMTCLVEPTCACTSGTKIHLVGKYCADTSHSILQTLDTQTSQWTVCNLPQFPSPCLGVAPVSHNELVLLGKGTCGIFNCRSQKLERLPAPLETCFCYNRCATTYEGVFLTVCIDNPRSSRHYWIWSLDVASRSWRQQAKIPKDLEVAVLFKVLQPKEDVGR